MTPEQLNELKQIVAHFHGRTPTDVEINDYCTAQGLEAIDAGTLEDWTFQYDTDVLRIDVLPDICDVIAAWKPVSGFASSEDQRASFRQLERDILAIFEKRDVPFNVAVSVMENLATIGTIIKNASLLATDKKVAIANTFITQHFGADPNKVSVGSYAQVCKELAGKASE